MKRILFGLILLSIPMLAIGGAAVFWLARTATHAVAEVHQRAVDELPKLENWSSGNCVAVATGMLSFDQWLSIPLAQNFKLLKDACVPGSRPSDRCEAKTCPQV